MGLRAFASWWNEALSQSKLGQVAFKDDLEVVSNLATQAGGLELELRFLWPRGYAGPKRL